MRPTSARILLFLFSAVVAFGVPDIVLDNFNSVGATGQIIASPPFSVNSSWVGGVQRNTDSITTISPAKDDNGWGVTNLSTPINATGMNFITIVGQRDGGNFATNFAIQFEDGSLNTQVFSVATASFASGSLTTVQIPISGWTAPFTPNNITGWSIGGGGVGNLAFRMTLDNLSLSATAIPEPATVGVIMGLAGAGLVYFRRRRLSA